MEYPSNIAPKNRTQLLGLRITKPLIELCQSKDVIIRKAAVACIAAITESSNHSSFAWEILPAKLILDLDETHPDLRKKDLIEVLISSLSVKEAAEVQDEAAYALSNLAKDCMF
jgi:HEAT repeat protein